MFWVQEIQIGKGGEILEMNANLFFSSKESGQGDVPAEIATLHIS